MSDYLAYQYFRFVYVEEFDPNVDTQEELMRQLNELGAQGWEMISIKKEIFEAHRNPRGVDQPFHTAYFKRPYIKQTPDGR